MKYIFYILFIACISTISFFYSSSSAPTVDDYAVRIDGRTISSEEVAKLKLQSPSLFSGSDDLPDSLIMREVLITEALRQNVDQEEAFRHRIKTFYEQSLVTILVERKMDSITYVPQDADIVAYSDFLGRNVEIDLIPLTADSQPIMSEVEHLSGPFLDFSETIRMEILFLKIGIRSKPVHLFGRNYVLIVQKIGDKDPTFARNDQRRDLAVIQEYRRQELFMMWQEALMQQAEVVVAPKEKEHRR